MASRWLALILAASVVAGCSPALSGEAPAAVVVAGTNRGESFARNALAGYDADWEMTHRTELPRFHVSSVAVDHLGRVWLGEAWNDQSDGRTVSVWESDERVAEVTVGVRPEGGLAQFGDRMAVGVAEAGFGFSIWSIGIETFDSREEVRVDDLDGSFLLLTAIAATDDHLLAAAIHDRTGESGDRTHTTLWWFDHSYRKLGKLDLGPDTTVWSLTPLDNGDFLVLNNSGFLADAPDLGIFDPESGEFVEWIRGSGYAFKGEAEGGKLYVVDRIWSSVHIDERRGLTIVDRGQVTRVPLPDDLGVEDIAVRDGVVYLAVWSRGRSQSDGVYMVDDEGSVIQVVTQEDASGIVFLDREK